MRRALAAVLVACALPTLARAQDSTAARPAFHAGQWAARFSLSSGFTGIGALHFSTPNKAWTLFASLSADFSEYGGTTTTTNQELLSLGVGRRWYRPGSGRVRPFGGLGISATTGRNHGNNAGSSQTSVILGGAFRGELGASIFFAPELSLGASWSAGVGLNHSRSYQNGSYVYHVTSASVSGGTIALEGVFYF